MDRIHEYDENKMLMSSENEEPTQPPKQKTLGLIGAMSIVVGCIIGSGIFITVGPTMMATPTNLLYVILFWITGGTVSLIGGMCYAELGSIIPKSGGERTYFTEAFGFRFGVTFTYVYVFLIKTITAAVLALTIGTFATEAALPNCEGVQSIVIMIGSTCLIIVFILNAVSNTAAARIQIIFTVIKLSALGLIIGCGFYHMGVNKPNPELKPSFSVESLDIPAIGTALINVFWSMEGWNTLGPVVGEMRNPALHLPIAVIFGVIIVLVLYCLVIMSYVQVLGYNLVMSTVTVAINFAGAFFGKYSFIISILICCSAFGALNGTMMSVSRVTMMSAYEGEIPGVFALVHRTKRTPIISLFGLLVGTFIFITLELQNLITYCAVATWLFYFLSMTALLVFKYRKMPHISKFYVPFFLVPIVQIVALIVIVMSFVGHPAGCTYVTILVLAIFGIHWIPERYLKPKFLVNAHNKLSKFLQVSYDLVPADASDVS